MSETENDTEALDGCAVCEGADIQNLPPEFNLMSLCAEHCAAARLTLAAPPLARSQEVAAIEQATNQILPSNPMEMVARALEKGIDGPMLQQFMDLQERYEGNEARKAYAAAMAKCQAKMPVIVADTPNTQTESLYAKLGKINAAIVPVYTKEGFSLLFDEVPTEGEMIRTRGRVIHKLGHVEEFTYDLPLDIAGIRDGVNKTAVHAKGSTTTYARRYLTTMIFNLAVGDDLDGNLPGGASGRVSEEESMKLGATITDYGLNADAILREFAVLNWEQLPTKKLEKAQRRIQQLGEARQR